MMIALTLLLALDAGTLRDAGPTLDAAAPLAVTQLTAHLEGDGVQPGDLVHLVVSFVHPTAVAVQLPEQLPDGKGMARAGAVERTLSGTDAGVRETLRIPFVLLDRRGVKSPGFDLRVGDDELAVPALPLTVADAGPSAGPPEVSFSAMSVQRPGFPKWVEWGALGVLLLIATVVLLRRWRRRTPQPLAPPPAPVDPAVEARTALAALRAGLVDEEMALRAAWFELMEVLRGYLDGRFGLAASHSTSLELLRSLGQMRVPGFPRSEFKLLLSQADTVRYARGAVDLVQIADLIDQVEAWVDAAERVAGASNG